MTTLQTTPVSQPKAAPPSSKAWTAAKEKSKLYLLLYCLIAPTVLGMLVFNYYPKFEAIWMSLYDWDGQQTKDFIGLKNFTDLFTGRDPLFWPTFQLVGILLVANLIKMWPSMFTAIALHRIKSEKWQYFYRVMFVVPMVIPGLVWLLIWKNFFDPNIGILNNLLNATGLMRVLNALDSLMPKVAAGLQPVVTSFAAPVFSSVWGMFLFGTMVLSCLWGWRDRTKAWVWWSILVGVGFFLVGPVYLAAMLAVAVVLGELRKSGRGAVVVRSIGWGTIAAGAALVLLTMIWSTPTKQFEAGTPSWLSNEKLVIPSLILWGFPWIGTVGVLIYLAGLQGISQDVYEAAELDGVSSIGRIFRIELPLMMTQVRINLIFMTIGTLTDYGLILLLLGADGGPKNVGMVPGLYMYKKAFVEARFGYACALGMVMFALILLITVIYQKYVKVDK
jgi:ABC-type sugar transport system permease subunit